MRKLKITTLLLLAVASANTTAQINFKAENVEIKQRALRPSDVRAHMDRKDYKNAKEIALQCLKETGDAWCEYYAGSLTYSAPGIEPDEEEGLKLIQSAANKNVSSAQVFIGNLYFNGAGFPKSATDAIAWWTRAANNCNAWAQNALARTYYDGEHATQDAVEAYYWVNLAAYYRFPNSDRGVDVIGGQLSDDAKKQVESRKEKFVKASGCGSSPAKPVVHDNWSNQQ